VKQKPWRKGKGKRFAMLPVMVLETLAVTTLSHAAFRVLVLLTAQFNGFNNGAIGITAKQATGAGIGSDKTLYQSLRELELRQLVELSYPASRVPPRPTMWSLTWLPLNDTQYSQSTRTPSHAYRDWKPERSVA
jgi:hypothetical protein